MRRLGVRALVAMAILAGASSAFAASVNVTFVQLTGVTGGSPAGTGVYRADLSGLGLASIQSITITDSNSGIGGAGSQFSGFDLDAIMLSNTSVADAASAAALVGISAFDFNSGTAFLPGTQRPPPDPKLFGTDATGNALNNTVATLGAFDANSATDFTAFGYISMGDGGSLIFNLNSAISTTGLYLYIGEVGDNGEVAAGTISVSDERSLTPLPAAAWAGFATLGLLGAARKLRARKA